MDMLVIKEGASQLGKQKHGLKLEALLPPREISLLSFPDHSRNGK